MAREYRIAVIPGDGIGREAVPEGCKVLKAVEEVLGDFHLHLEEYPWGTEYYLKHGRMMPQVAMNGDEFTAVVTDQFIRPATAEESCLGDLS